MRISTAQYFETSAAKYQNNFSSIVKTQEQITSGVRIQSAGDDPVGAAQLLMLQQQKDMLGQYSANMGSIKYSLANEESVLDNINTALQRARELALSAGDGGKSDADRKSIAAELGEIEANVLSLLNSKDPSGNYMFAGSKSSTAPYVRNNDGTYTYQGDDTQLSLQVSNTLSITVNDTGKSILESATNSGRTQAILDPSKPNDGTVSVSAGLMNSNAAYTKNFTAGEPYELKFVDSTHYTVADKDGNDITSELPGNGVFDANKEGGSSISLRGVQFDITLRLKAPVDPVTNLPMTPDEEVKDHVFALGSKPDSFNASRTPSNDSTAVVTGSGIADPAAYVNGFPNTGVVVKFTDATNYKVYAQPMGANSQSIGGGALTAGSITVAGVKLDFTGAPQADDQFVVGASGHKTQSALDTLSQLRQVLETPSDESVMQQIKLKDALNSAIGNLANSSEQVLSVQGAIGARLNSVDFATTENTSLDLTNASMQAAIGNTDVATASIDLAFQQSLLQASQLAFVKIAQLSLFNKL
ncbi:MULTISPECIES: flagellar hook-associated protein 3 [unclassified Pseudomonas]|jgi:flagellar hook-associated protein 3 FlgL|uniref:flagellar hook-associated protein 3 n=1 Tax=unclassified Pseudomonas TaxID=196821 RepID=UPI00069CD64B|nr:MULTISPECIES: flagellar hook-associated protein 3 [unclassified Pseudomonas]WPN48752.1 flagellar hook-associated protein 3 [Pseudomonas sp. P8_241]